MRPSTHFIREVCMSPKSHLRCRLGAIICLILAWIVMVPTRADVSSDPQVTEGFVNAPIAEVWRIFTTSEGFKITGVSQANVDLRVGGLIRSHYDAKGSLGDPETVVNEILAYEPERMLAIRIKQPPASFQFKNAIEGTWSVIYFTPSGQDMTHVRIVGLGYRDTPESQALRKFFAEGNRSTLDHIAKRYWPKCKLCAAEPAATEVR
jgi:uncharacterized protein YndB with AHSA1/START domain